MNRDFLCRATRDRRRRGAWLELMTVRQGAWRSRTYRSLLALRSVAVLGYRLRAVLPYFAHLKSVNLPAWKGVLKGENGHVK